VNVDVSLWPSFFSKKAEESGFLNRYKPAGFEVVPTDEQNLIAFQRKLERREGPYFLHGAETIKKDLKSPLTVYRPGDVQMS
jgi:hypothetical protein